MGAADRTAKIKEMLYYRLSLKHERLSYPCHQLIPGALNIDPGLTPTSPVLSAPRGGEGRYGGATSLLSAPGGGEAG